MIVRGITQQSLGAELGLFFVGDAAHAIRATNITSCGLVDRARLDDVSIGVQLWLDLLTGNLHTSWWHRLEWVAGQGIRADAGAVGPADDCRLCRAERW